MRVRGGRGHKFAAPAAESMRCKPSVTVTRTTGRVAYKLSVSRLLMNVNTAVSGQEMRKRERERAREEEEEEGGCDGGSDGGGSREEEEDEEQEEEGGHNYKSFISSENHKVSSQKGS